MVLFHEGIRATVAGVWGSFTSDELATGCEAISQVHSDPAAYQQYTSFVVADTEPAYWDAAREVGMTVEDVVDAQLDEIDTYCR